MNRSTPSWIVAASALVGLWWPGSAYAGPVVRVGVTTDTVTDVAVGGGRVFWASWGADDASVFSAGMFSGARRLLRVPDLEALDDVSSYLWASPQRVAVQVETYYADLDADYNDIAAYASGRVGDASMRPLSTSPRPGFERIQDIAGDEVLTVAAKRLAGRWTVRAYVRALGGPQPVGPRLTLARDEGSSTVEGRLSTRWMALLRHRGGDPRITVYDRRTNRPAWSVRLPRGARPLNLGWDIVWDLDEDGTLAVALGTVRSGTARASAALGWVRPRATFRRATRAVLPRYPFVLRAGTLTYTRQGTKNRVRLYARRHRGTPRALTGDLPSEHIDTDGNVVAVAVSPERDPTYCILAATLPVAPSQRWPCPRASGGR